MFSEAFAIFDEYVEVKDIISITNLQDLAANHFFVLLYTLIFGI